MYRILTMLDAPIVALECWGGSKLIGIYYTVT